MSTAQQVIQRLDKVKLEGKGTYRANSPFRLNSDSHSFVLTCSDDEHGAWKDHVSGESGSLYELARFMGIETPRANVTSTKRAYTGLADYAQAHGIGAADLERRGWTEVTCSYGSNKGRRALEYPTRTGRRWRFIDGNEPRYGNEKGYKSSWYGLTQDIVDLVNDGSPLVMCNGEISTISGQCHFISAVCITGGEGNNIRSDLIDVLKDKVPGATILVAMDADKAGRESSIKRAEQLRAAGFKARPIDLGLSGAGDLADFCMLYGADARTCITECPDLVVSVGQELLSAAPAYHDYGLPKDKIIGQGRSWIMLHSDNLRFLPQVTWALKPYIPSRGLVVIYGPSGTGKTFLALWFALQIAQQFPVLYMAYEGEYGYQARIRASQNYYHFGHGITLTLGQVDLMSDDDFATFIDSARKVKPSVVFVDTLARSMSGMDENSTRDMGTYITRCNLLMSELNCSVVIVHHTSKGGSIERGSVALRGAADVMIRLEDSDERVLVECAKTKDGKPFQSFHIRLHSVDTMLADEFGQPVFTPVAVLANDDYVPETLLTKHQHAILSQMILELYSDDGMTFAQIEAGCPQMSRSTLINALSSLKKRGYIDQSAKREPYAITESGREALNSGKPWIAPAEEEKLTEDTEKPATQAELIPDTTSAYHKAGL